MPRNSLSSIMWAEVIIMINDEKKLLEFMSNFYNIPVNELTRKYTISQLEAAYTQITYKTNYQKHLDDKHNFQSEYLMKEFSPL